jgi:hypothetical protein
MQTNSASDLEPKKQIETLRNQTQNKSKGRKISWTYQSSHPPMKPPRECPPSSRICPPQQDGPPSLPISPTRREGPPLSPISPPRIQPTMKSRADKNGDENWSGRVGVQLNICNTERVSLQHSGRPDNESKLANRSNYGPVNKDDQSKQQNRRYLNCTQDNLIHQWHIQQLTMVTYTKTRAMSP